MKSYAWMKLLLDPEQATKFDDPSLAASQGEGILTKPPGKSAVDLCADYLSEVAAFAYTSLAKRVSLEILQVTPLDFWFTVPAVWSDRAKHDTLQAARRAAKKASLRAHPDSRVFLIREPEAAAIATLSNLTQGGVNQQVKSGDHILVCDCGGGTVDITTYKITSVAPKLTFEELVVGAGGKCGSTHIDREFVKWMTAKFGHGYTSLLPMDRGPASDLMKQFENHKKNFGKEIPEPYEAYEIYKVGMSGVKESINYDEDDGTIKLYYHDLKAMFDTVVSKIVALLQSQLDDEVAQTGTNKIKTILLVGGFGDSAYLNTVLYEWAQARGMRMFCPEGAQTAIVRGAAYSGLHDLQPSSRRSRLHYGFACHEAFDPVRHDPRDRFIWNWDGSARAKGQLDWQLGKGDAVDESTSIEGNFCRTMFEDSAATSHSVQVLTSDVDDAPYNVRDTDVRKLVKMKLDFSGVDMSQFESRIVDGRIMRRVSMQYIIEFGHRRGVLIFKCLVGGAEIGTTTVTFDGQSSRDRVDVEASGESGGAAPICSVQ